MGCELGAGAEGVLACGTDKAVCDGPSLRGVSERACRTVDASSVVEKLAMVFELHKKNMARAESALAFFKSLTTNALPTIHVTFDSQALCPIRDLISSDGTPLSARITACKSSLLAAVRSG
jgi:hypothetical protein